MKGTGIGTQEPPSSSLHHWHGLSENPHKSISHQSMFPPFLLKKYGWWFQPLWKKLVTWEYYSQYIGKIKFMFQTTNQKLSTQNHLQPIQSHVTSTSRGCKRPLSSEAAAASPTKHETLSRDQASWLSGGITQLPPTVRRKFGGHLLSNQSIWINDTNSASSLG